MDCLNCDISFLMKRKMKEYYYREGERTPRAHHEPEWDFSPKNYNNFKQIRNVVLLVKLFENDCGGKITENANFVCIFIEIVWYL